MQYLGINCTPVIIIFLQFKEADMGQLMDSKLRCVFELPADAAAQAPQNNLDASPALQPHVEAKPSPKASIIYSGSSRNVVKILIQG